MKTLRNRLCAVFFACTAQSAWSEQPQPSIETVAVYERALPTTTTRIDRSALAPGRETGDSLRDLLGVSGSRMGGHGIDPTIRGLSQTQLNVLLDGAYVHGGCPNRMDPPTAYANATGYDEVTVIRGIQTLAYGGGGPGGTVVFNRSKPRFEAGGWLQGELSASWLSNGNTGNIGADLAFGEPQGYVRFLASGTNSGNYNDGNGVEVRSAHEERGGSVILGWTPSHGRQVELSWNHQETLDALFPGAGMDSPKANNDTVKLSAEIAEVGGLSNVKLELYRSAVNHIMDNFSLRDLPAADLEAPSTSDTTGGRLVAELDTELGLLKMGVDSQYNKRSASRWMVGAMGKRLNSIMWPQVSIDQTGAFAELRRQPTSTVTLLGGVRYDYVRSKARKTSEDPAGLPQSPEALYGQYYDEISRSRQDHNIGGLLRIEYSPADYNTRIFASVARSVRTPDASERYLASNGKVPSANWVGNPTLKPETHHQLDAGLLTGFEHTTLALSLYVNQIHDYVLRDRFADPANYASIYRNIDARLMGGEGQLTWQLLDTTSLELGISYVHGENTTDNRAIAQMPPLEGFAVLTWKPNTWQFSVEARGAARQNRVDTTSSTGIPGQGLDVTKTPGWGIINLRARWSLSALTHLELGVDNLLDRRYTQHLNRGNAFSPDQIQVNEPGRGAWVSLHTSF